MGFKNYGLLVFGLCEEKKWGKDCLNQPIKCRFHRMQRKEESKRQSKAKEFDVCVGILSLCSLYSVAD